MQSNRGEAEEEEEEREEKKKGTTERKSAPQFPRFEKLIRNTDRILGWTTVELTGDVN